MYISVSDAAKKFNLSKRRVQTLCEQGRIYGANMVSGVWLIPDTAIKPSDGRKKKVEGEQLSFFDLPQQAFTVDDICKILSISNATAKNWIRLGKIVPDVCGQLFSYEYAEKLITEIRSANTLKSRRNKKNITGKFIYKDYIHTASNQRVVTELLELDVIESEKDLLIILANFAIQLYYQSHEISYSKNDVLLDFLSSNDVVDSYNFLIKDLLGNINIDPVSLSRLSKALSKKLHYVKGEDSLGLVYISLRDISQRKSSGVYYTPEIVVQKLIDKLFEIDVNMKQKKICDPCCGTGNFLISLVSRGIDSLNIYGQDIDPISVYLSRINIALMNPQMPVAEIYSHIIIGNTLFETFENKFDIVVGNPPWGSSFSEEDMHRCHKIFKTAVNKSIESYDLFVEKALTMLNPKGLLAFIVPEAILSVTSHDAIRQFIIDSCSFKFISYLGNVFSGVQCPSIILGITLDYNKNVVGCMVTTENRHFVISQPRIFTNKTFSFNVSDDENECLNAISNIKNAVYLKNNAKFALGIVTGNNKDYISTQKQENNEIILKGSNIQRYGITFSENYIRFVPESFQQVAPTELYRAKEKLFYRFICEVPVFTYDNQQRISLNSCNIVIPEIDDLEIKYILAILNSSVAAFFISKKFNSVKLLRSHIEQMPIPKVSIDVQASIIKKVDNIMEASENIDSIYENLDQDIFKLFNLTSTQKKVIKDALQGKNLFLCR